MGDGAFSAAARAAIYEAGQGRCIGCGSAQVTAQHRQSRGMGGTSSDSAAAAVNGLPLCGSGTTGCHGWTERHPVIAGLLGWRLDRYGNRWNEPWWSRYGWRRWALIDGMPLVVYVDEAELDEPAERGRAVAELHHELALRAVI